MFYPINYLKSNLVNKILSSIKKFPSQIVALKKKPYTTGLRLWLHGRAQCAWGPGFCPQHCKNK
jgi:hypothetical protein